MVWAMIPPIMENQLKRNTEHDMEIGVIKVV